MSLLLELAGIIIIIILSTSFSSDCVPVSLISHDVKDTVNARIGIRASSELNDNAAARMKHLFSSNLS